MTRLPVVLVLAALMALAPAVLEAQRAGGPAAGAAQEPASRGTPPAGRGGLAPAPTPAQTDELIEPPGFTYNPEGRRDPFVSLARRGGTAAGGGNAPRPAGIAGLGVAEVTLRGTMRGREGFVGVLQGADQRTYIVRAGDKLFDGTIRTITQNDMVIVQQVNDPLSLEKQREVRKVLRQVEAN
jgi:Tfp pilus assembly protein PilP